MNPWCSADLRRLDPGPNDDSPPDSAEPTPAVRRWLRSRKSGSTDKSERRQSAPKAVRDRGSSMISVQTFRVSRGRAGLPGQHSRTHVERIWQTTRQKWKTTAVTMTDRQGKIRPEEYRSRWGARASNPLEGALASSVGSTPASSAIRQYESVSYKIYRAFPRLTPTIVELMAMGATFTGEQSSGCGENSLRPRRLWPGIFVAEGPVLLKRPRRSPI